MANKEKARPEVGKYAKVYRGPEQLKVTVLRYGPEANREFLIGIDGVDHACDGQIFLHKTENAGTGRDFKMTYDGKSWTTFLTRENFGYENCEARPPGFKDFVKVAYDEQLSLGVQPEHMLTAFLERKGK